eukprot:CAMPEP_0170625374 /NCGR_PEP_ID=MMETSP0224-20130122/30723_1 /TAXON_ID=285029 /ORGANISM="Togula jolla, Strain CCCM 725" /LENGTH=250 /DNA_ID=CAMNT_0010951941 /DNA_START=18 /DNA_END=770 /DNA_ORIENTATION=+
MTFMGSGTGIGAKAWLEVLSGGLKAQHGKDFMAVKKGNTFAENSFGTLSTLAALGARSMAGPPCASNTLIILDWDDTLLCSSELQKGPSAVDPEELAVLGELAFCLVQLAQSLGPVAIVTNSKDGWVEESAARFLPLLLPIVQQIPVIYARKEYSELFPRSSLQWKLQTFLELQRLNASTITNFVVVGDSNDEMTAAAMLGEQWPGVLVKQVKLLAKPSLSELVQELQILLGEFTGVVESMCSERLDVQL